MQIPLYKLRKAVFSLLLADGGLPVLAGHVVELDAVVVEVVEDGEAVAAALGLRAGEAARRPEAGAARDALRAAVLPVEGARVTEMNIIKC